VDPARRRVGAQIVSLPPSVGHDRPVLATRSVMVACSLLAAGCGGVGDEDGGGPADFSGRWSFALTNGANACGFADWNEGATTTDIPVSITQSGAEVSAVIEGLWGTFFQLQAGGRTLTGQAEGDSVALTLQGDTAHREGACTWTWIARVDGEIDGDLLTGYVEYVAATNGHDDCGQRNDCATTQEFNATRPP
jgi:hypothetical protein